MAKHGESAKTDWSKEEFLKEHAISEEVFDARGYYCYEKDDPEGLLRKVEGDADDERQVVPAWPEDNADFAEYIAKQQPGLIIPRYAPPDLGLEHVYAEIRPDGPIQTRKPYQHYHDRRRPTDEEREKVMRQKDARSDWVSNSWTLRKHIRKSRKRGGHGGWSPSGVHPRFTWAKYVFPKGPYARRIDMLPRAWDLLKSAERVYFVIEGCIKSDAILSEIIRTKEPSTVISVPSVTLWPFEADTALDDDHHLLAHLQSALVSELELVAEALVRDKEVVIIPDADWRENVLVYSQAMQLRTFLRNRDFNAHVAAPPFKKDDPRDEDGKLLKNGVDDYLAGGGKLADMDVGDRYLPVLDVAVRERFGRGRHRIKLYSARLLAALSLHSGIETEDDGKTLKWTNDGTVCVSVEKRGKILGIEPRTAQLTMKDLREETDDAVELISGLETVAEGWHRRGKPLEDEPELDPDGTPADDDVYWSASYVQQPVYLLHEDFRPGPLELTKLGKPGSLKAPPTKEDIARMLREDFSDKIIESAGEPIRVSTLEEWLALQPTLPPLSGSGFRQVRIEIIEYLLDYYDVAPIAKGLGLDPSRIRQIKRELERKRMSTETNERLARIEAQLAEVRADVSETLARVCGRFPEDDADVRAAVEQFIAVALSQENAA
jgi:hypothetical protein